MNRLVFVYGTLKRGFSNHSLLKNSEFICEWKTKPKFKMISLGWYPGVVRGGLTSICGELFSVDDVTMGRLDRLEGYPKLYDRIKIPTKHGIAYMYTFNSDSEEGYNEIIDGVWK